MDDTRVIVVTGATGGIGRALAERLAAASVTVALAARDRSTGEAAQRAIVAATGNPRVELYRGDLSSMASVRELAVAIGAAHPALDGLIHCAATYTRRRSVTSDGFERMLATNVLAPFLLTNLLVDRLRAASRARILVLSAPSTVKLDFDDLQSEHRFRSLTTFGATKAADLLFTFELARRLAGTGVTANAVHPGLARTNLMRQAPRPLRWLTRLVSAPPDNVAAAIAPLVLAPEFAETSGRFLHAGHDIAPPTYTLDPDVARHLWAVSAELVGLDEAATA